MAKSIFNIDGDCFVQYFDKEWETYIDFNEAALSANKFKIVQIESQDNYSSIIMQSESNILDDQSNNPINSNLQSIFQPDSHSSILMNDMLQSPTISTHSSRVKWPIQFDVRMCPMSPNVTNALLSEKQLSWREKSVLMHDLCCYIKEFTRYPTSDQYNEVAQNLVKTYPYLTESIGSGHDGWKQKIRDQMKNSRRKDDSIEVKAKKEKFGKRRKPSHDENYDPEADETLIDNCRATTSTDNTVLTEQNMVQTFNDRRQKILQKMKAEDLKNQYPSLFTKCEIEREFVRITDVPLYSKIDDWLKENAEHVFSFIDKRKIISKEVSNLKNIILNFSGHSCYKDLLEKDQKYVQAAVLLPCLFQEKNSLFFDIVQVNSFPIYLC